MSIKSKVQIVALAGALGLAAASQAVSFNFSSAVGASIRFDGAGNFRFLPETVGADVDFKVTSGTASGLLGDIGGVFSIGTITPVGLGFEAPVSGVGTFTVYDGANWLTADLVWDKLFQLGIGSTLNVSGVVNMSNIVYAGSNPDLLGLFNDGSGVNTVTFQFIPKRDIAYLKSHAIGTSFSGSVLSVAVPDGGTTAVLLGLGVCGLALGWGRRTL